MYLYSNQKMKKIRISSSISNFREKLLKRTKLEEWRWNIFTPTLFVGMYHWGDIIRFILQFGKKKVFFCGSDIKKIPWWFSLISTNTKYYCENDIEQEVLMKKGIYAEVLPMIFTEFESKNCLKPSKKIHVYLTMHEGREEEYGMDVINTISRKLPDITFHIYGQKFPPLIELVESLTSKLSLKFTNVIFHGKVHEEQFNKEIRNYHCALRLNEFDGFSETVAKSILLGQYPITKIKYPKLWNYDSIDSLIERLNSLKYMLKGNPYRLWWKKELDENLEKLLK